MATTGRIRRDAPREDADAICGVRRAIVADIAEGEAIVAILAHLELPTEAPPLARARSPAFDFA